MPKIEYFFYSKVKVKQKKGNLANTRARPIFLTHFQPILTFITRPIPIFMKEYQADIDYFFNTEYQANADNDFKISSEYRF